MRYRSRGSVRAGPGGGTARKGGSPTTITLRNEYRRVSLLAIQVYQSCRERRDQAAAFRALISRITDYHYYLLLRETVFHFRFFLSLFLTVGIRSEFVPCYR